MKFKLPKALLVAVLASMAATSAYAEEVAPDKYYDDNLTGAFIVKDTYKFGAETAKLSESTSDKALLETALIDGSKSASPTPIIKVGSGTYTIDESITMNNPLVVREGTVKVENSTITSLMSSPLSSYVPFLSVGGKDAVLELNNAHISHKIEGTNSYAVAMSLGSPDGKATINLENNSTLHTDHYIMAGDVDGQRYTLTTWGVKPAEYCALGTGYGKGTVDEGTSKFYSDGDKGQTVVNISGGSTLSAGSSLQFAHVAVTISGEGSLLTDNTLNRKDAHNHCSYLGHESSYEGDFTTDIKIEKGGSFVSNWNLVTGGKQRAENTPNSTVIITVGSDAEDGKTSTFKVKGHLGMGDYFSTSTAASSSSNTTVTVKDGAKAILNVVTVGAEGKAKLIVEEGGSIQQVAAEERYYYHPEKNGDYSATGTPIITVNETGTIENSGIIELDITVNGGTYLGDGDADQFGGSVFTILDGSVVEGLTMTTGTVNISGEVSLTNVTFGTEVVAMYSLMTLSGESDALTLNISDGAIINADELVINETATINMVLSEDNTDNTGSITITGTDASKVSALKQQLEATMNTVDSTGATVDTGSVSITTNVVPEPATATLSLLALAGLCARRRRK